jgi:uncharacterized membrane protein
MSRNAWLFLAPLLLAGACSSTPRAYSPVQHPFYSAIGENPFWMVAIGDDRIVLRLGGENGAAAPQEQIWPRTLPRLVDGGRIWQSGEGTGIITIESRPEPCTGSRGTRYEDHVRVRLSGRELNGCGGRLVSPARQ